MLPNKIVRFLKERGNMALGGIRDRDMRPAGCRVSAWALADDGRTLTAYVPLPESYQARFLDALTGNGQFAFTIEEHPSHETYQLKGTYIRHRPSVEADRALVERYRERAARVFRNEIPAEFISRVIQVMHPVPTHVIDIDVHEVFVQTPGPGAGARIFPPLEDQAASR